MGRKIHNIPRTSTITNPESSEGLFSLCKAGAQVQRRKENSYFNMYKETKQKEDSKQLRKQINHANKTVTYNSECNGSHGRILLCNRTQKALNGRKKFIKENSSKNNIIGNVNQENANSNIGLYCSSSQGIGLQMPRRKKMVDSKHSANAQTIGEDCLWDAFDNKINCQLRRVYRNGTSKPKVVKSSIQLYKNPMHSKITEQKDHLSSIKIDASKLKKTNTLLPGKDQSKSYKPKRTVFDHQKTNIIDPESTERSKICMKLASQSYQKTKVFSSNDVNSQISEKKDARKLVRKLCPQSHKGSWIY